jgi:hypothetical protein
MKFLRAIAARDLDTTGIFTWQQLETAFAVVIRAPAFLFQLKHQFIRPILLGGYL